MKIVRLHWIFILLLIVGFFLRLIRFEQNYRIDDRDVVRDYLVARHIVVYKEFPATGPVNSFYPQKLNSPAYYYFLALPLYLHDSVYTLAGLNLFLHFTSIAALYVLALMMFGRIVATVATGFLVFNEPFMTQSYFMWQPWVVQAFLYWSYVCLAMSVRRHEARWLYASAALFMTSLGMGLYSLVVVAVYIGLVVWAVRRMRASIQTKIVLLGLTVIFWFLMYGTVLVSLIQKRELWQVFTYNGYVTTLNMYIHNIVQNTSVFLGGFGNEYAKGGWGFLVGIGVIALILRFVWIRYKKRQYIPAIILLSVILTVLQLSFFQGDIQSWHFVAVSGPFFILTIASIMDFWRKKLVGRIVVCLLIAIIASTTLVSPTYLSSLFYERNIGKTQLGAARAIAGEARGLHGTYGTSWPEHFRVATYHKNPSYHQLDFIFWPFVEQYTDTKLTTLDLSPSNVMNFRPFGHLDGFINIVCADYESLEDANNTCLLRFHKEYPAYKKINLIYQDGPRGRYIIFFASRE